MFAGSNNMSKRLASCYKCFFIFSETARANCCFTRLPVTLVFIFPPKLTDVSLCPMPGKPGVAVSSISWYSLLNESVEEVISLVPSTYYPLVFLY